MNKRYAIVRVDNKCPDWFEKTKNSFVCKLKMAKDGFHLDCSDCRYGDTKEQLIKKVAQVIFRRKLKLYRKIWGGEMGSIERKDVYSQCLEIAKEIVEFLGVKDDK